MLAGVLVAAFATAMLPVATGTSSAGHVEQPAACHSDMPSAPAPSAPSHRCCATGHNWAVPGSSIILDPVVAQVGVHKETHDPRPFLFNDGPVAFVSDSPPITTSLRI